MRRYSGANMWYGIAGCLIVVALMGCAVSGSSKATRMTGEVEAGTGWAEYGGHWYKLLEPASWSAQRTAAAKLGSYIVTINDDAENQWIVGNFIESVDEMLADRIYRWVYIGLTYAKAQGTHVWLNGDPVEFLNWGADDPNHHVEGPGYGPEEQTVMTFARDEWTEGVIGRWIDIDGDPDAAPFWFVDGRSSENPAIVEADTIPY
jgi:hypothetical protein